MDKNKFPMSQYSTEFLFKIGRVEDAKKRKNYFTKFPYDKKKETIRIGAFGDSFTYGDGVNKGWSYPSQLQDIFNERLPEKKVEVLNFGMGAHGMQQHFLVWKEYAKKYNIDYVLLGPYGVQSDRDPAFTPPWNNQHYFKPPRGRYILKKDGTLKFVNISGDTFLERYKNYYTLLPSTTILRYDKYFFNLWRRIYLPFLDLKIRNPFYYTHLNTEAEALTINTILLQEIIQRHQKKIIYITGDHPLYRLYKIPALMSSLNLNYLFFPYDSALPLYLRKGHLTTLGYELWAEVFYNAITGNKDFTLQVFQCKKESVQSKTKVNKKIQTNIENIKDVFIYHKDIQIAEVRPKHVFHYEKVKSFITFSSAMSEWMQSLHFTTPFLLSAEQKIFIKGGGRKIKLGPISYIDKQALFFTFKKGYITQKHNHYSSTPSLFFHLNKPEDIKSIQKTRTLTLYIDDFKVADLKKYDESKGMYEIKWTTGEVFSFDGLLSHSIKLESLPRKISFSLQYILQNNKIIRSSIPNFFCVKQDSHFSIDLPFLDFI